MSPSVGSQWLDPPVDAGEDHTLGAPDAPISLVEYGSYACANCRAAHDRIVELRDQFGERLVHVFRHRPLPGNQLAIDAAELAEIAAQHGKFWKAHVALMTRSGELQQEDLDHVARELDLVSASPAERKRAARRVREDARRGLSIDGAGTTPGLNGVRFISGRSLMLQDVFIQNQNSGSGISFQPSRAAELHANNVTVTDGGHGILIQPTGATGSAKVTLTNVRFHNNSNSGLRIDATSNTSTAGISVEVDHGDFNGNSNGGITVLSLAGTNPIRLMLTNSNVVNNLSGGVITNGTGVTAHVGNTTITGNATGVLAAGGSTLTSFGTNRNFGNPTIGGASNGAFTSTIGQN